MPKVQADQHRRDADRRYAKTLIAHEAQAFENANEWLRRAAYTTDSVFRRRLRQQAHYETRNYVRGGREWLDRNPITL